MSNADSWVDSSSAASIAREPKRRRWADAGMPVMGSSRDLKWAIDQDGETRRSEEELAEEISRGTSLLGRRSILMKQTQGDSAISKGRKHAKKERGTGLLLVQSLQNSNRIL